MRFDAKFLEPLLAAALPRQLSAQPCFTSPRHPHPPLTRPSPAPHPPALEQLNGNKQWTT